MVYAERIKVVKLEAPQDAEQDTEQKKSKIQSKRRSTSQAIQDVEVDPTKRAKTQNK